MRGWSQSVLSWRRCHWLKLQAVEKEAHLVITAHWKCIWLNKFIYQMYKPLLMSLMEALMHRGALNLHHIAIGHNELSEAALPHKTQLTLGVEYKMNFSRWLNHLELIQTLLPGLIVWSLCWSNKQTYKSFRGKKDRNKANNLQWLHRTAGEGITFRLLNMRASSLGYQPRTLASLTIWNLFF